MAIKEYSKKIIATKWFEMFIALVIVANCFFIGVETYFHSHKIHIIQQVALSIFIVEIFLRFFARESLKAFFSSGWNMFDLSLILLSLVPESLFAESTEIISLRILRVFRVLRLLRASPEIKMIAAVLIRSIRTLTYNALFFIIFLYLFAIVGTTLFRLPVLNEQSPPDIIEKYNQILNNPTNYPDPYGTLHESMYTLFKIATGDNWSDIRYDLIGASKLGLIHAPPYAVTFFHIMWFCLAAFLLLNLVLGAIVNNYQIIMDELNKKKQD
jgi:voltage-gated sodium channel